jgi:hypothetical protein
MDDRAISIPMEAAVKDWKPIVSIVLKFVERILSGPMT